MKKRSQFTCLLYTSLTERDDRQLYALLGLEQVKMAQEKHPEQDYGTLAALLNGEKEQNE